MDELSRWLRLWHAPGLGPAGTAKLLTQFETLPRLFSSRPGQLLDCGLSKNCVDYLLAEPEPVEISTALDWANQDDNHILTLADPRYPELLRNTDRPPPLLAIKGNPNILGEPQLAIVGSRSPSQGGRDNAFQFARHLSRAGLIITSGLALGIDGEAHKGALAGGSPTIAVTATGLDRVYPARHKELAHRIVSEGGAIISEFPLGTSPRPENFPQRNRLISGLSLGTLVVEAAIRSGSLITARYAREQGREVFAIPGSIHNPLSKGCHQLIKHGGKLVETASDIIEELAPQLEAAICPPASPTPAQPQQLSLSTDQRQLLDTMGFDPVTIDQLSEKTPFQAAEIASMLLILELGGHVASEAGGRYQRRDNNRS